MNNFEIYRLKLSAKSKITWHAIASFTDDRGEDQGKEIYLYAKCFKNGNVRLDKEYTTDEVLKTYPVKVKEFLEKVQEEWDKMRQDDDSQIND